MCSRVAVVARGRLVASGPLAEILAFKVHGWELVMSHVPPHALECARKAGRRAELFRGDIADPEVCPALVAKALAAFGRIDVLVNNAAFQMNHESLEEIPDEEWDYTIATNLSAFFHLAKASVPHMKPGASIIGSSSVNSDMPSPTLLPCCQKSPAVSTSVPCRRSKRSPSNQAKKRSLYYRVNLQISKTF